MTQTEALQQRIESLESTIKLMTHACRVVYAEMRAHNEKASYNIEQKPISRSAIKIMAEAIDRGDAVLKEKA